MPKGIKKAKTGALPPLAQSGKVPAGYDERKGGQWEFWNPKAPGDTLQGTLAGSTMIKSSNGELKKRLQLLSTTKDSAKLYTLPDHYDLMQKLETAQIGDGVYIKFLGKEVVEGVASPMARYTIGVKSHSERTESDVPF